MNRYALTHLDDRVLLRDLAVHVTRNCAATADLLAHLAEVDARKLYLPAAHPSMHSYCVHVLGLSEDAANKRIRVARKAREYPAIFTAVAEGQLHLSGAVLVVAHLTPDNVDELLAAAARKTKAEVEVLLARRFPRQDVPSRVAPVMASASSLLSNSEAPASAHQLAPGPVQEPRSRVTPLAPERFSVQFTVGQDTYETLRYVQALLGHQVPTGDVVEVFDRALEALKAELEKTRFAATVRPRAGRQRTSDNPRYVPTHVKRAVWVRDGGQCAFVSENGARCPERSRLEFDHIVEVARGGEATIDGMRLQPQPQPQSQPAPEPVNATSEQHEVDSDLLDCLKGLGWRTDAARLAMEQSRGNAEASIEERLHAAIKFLGARGRTYALRRLPHETQGQRTATHESMAEIECFETALKSF